MSTLELSNISLTQGPEDVIFDLSATLTSGINLLIGPTLAGKTTLMRIIAGLVKPTTGTVSLDGVELQNVAVQKRSVSFVYQQFINYPSLSVFDNIASPLRVSNQKLSKDEISHRVEEMANLLGLTLFLKRKPAELSGGQQQRVAIARALARKADVVLLDEPLANLDYKLREQLRAELQSIFGEQDSIVVYSTAEPAEALEFATNTFVMHEGRLLQNDTALAIYQKPVNVAVAKALADPPINLIDSEYSGHQAQFAGHRVELTRPELSSSALSKLTLGIQPGKVSLKPLSTSAVELNTQVQLAEVTGSSTFVHVKLENGNPIVIEVEGAQIFELDQKLKAYFDPADLYAFDPATGKSIFYPKGAVK